MQVHAFFLYQSLKLLNGIPFKAFYYFYIKNYQSWTKLPFDWPYIVLQCFVFKVKLPVFFCTDYLLSLCTCGAWTLSKSVSVMLRSHNLPHGCWHWRRRCMRFTSIKGIKSSYVVILLSRNRNKSVCPTSKHTGCLPCNTTIKRTTEASFEKKQLCLRKL